MSEDKGRERLCMSCINPLPEGRDKCGICGYPANGDNEAMYLPVHTLLSQRYIVGKLTEHTGDAAVYIGFDKAAKSPIIIREFFPDTLSERSPDGELRIISGCENAFNEYQEKFRIHARALARMRELSSITAVYDIFEQNLTTYTVSEYPGGNTLEARLKQVGGRMRWDEARPLFMPLIASLHSLHSAGIFHLGISPKNLFMGNDGKLILKGFCITEARRVNTDLRPRLIAGYSSPEQYALGREVGAQSDVYGLASTIFCVLTGNPPPEGSHRAQDSNDLFVPSDVAKELPDYIAAALFNALQVNPEQRTRSVEQFRDQLSTAPAVSRLREDEKESPEDEEPESELPPVKKNSRFKYAALIVLSVFIFLLLLAGMVLLWMFPNLFGGKDNTSGNVSGATTEQAIITTTSTQYVSEPEKFATPDLVGKSFYEVRKDTLIGKMKVEVEYKKYSNRPKGEILSQTPSPETPAEQGAAIKVVISAGPELITVPDVSGWDYRQATLYLEALGFRVQVMRIVSDTFDVDTVESIQEAGQKLAEGDTVNLRVSETKLTTATTEDYGYWW